MVEPIDVVNAPQTKLVRRTEFHFVSGAPQVFYLDGAENVVGEGDWIVDALDRFEVRYGGKRIQIYKRHLVAVMEDTLTVKVKQPKLANSQE